MSGSHQPGAGGAPDRLPDMVSRLKADGEGEDRDAGAESRQGDVEAVKWKREPLEQWLAGDLGPEGLCFHGGWGILELVHLLRGTADGGSPQSQRAAHSIGT